MRKPWKIAVLLSLLGCAHAPEASAPADVVRSTAQYTVTISDNFDGARVRACFEGVSVSELVPVDDSRWSELKGAWLDGKSLPTARRRIHVGQTTGSTCVEYETSFANPMFRPSDSNAVVASQTQWLWRPEPFPSQLDASIRFVVPSGGDAWFPWPRSGSLYLPDESVFFVSAFGALGTLERQAFSVAGTNVEVARLGPKPSDEDIHSWIRDAMQATASLGDRFPRERIYFVIVPVLEQDKPVLFGMVRRGGGSSVLLVPSKDASAEKLAADWVAVHELSHLWLPPLRSTDRWLSEGMATYLQEVLRARCGMQSGERAWTRLDEGFARGRRAGTGRQLEGESAQMNRTGAYHRVYWAGAAFALEVDVRLRERSGGDMTLLRAIDEAQDAWGTDSRDVAAAVVLGALDDAGGTEFIEPLGRKYAAMSEFPDLEYVDSPKYRQIRAQITARVDGGCEVNAGSSR